ncbi:MAG: adenylyl-sulfate kinase [Bdellovibrionales bacterium]|nr:adenylyl-sulfate kinase [Bdellovibrionales bacterium]
MQSLKQGKVYWITGYAGAGKSTIARELQKSLQESGKLTVLVDGDEFRAIVGDSIGYTPEARLENAWRIARFCKFLSSQGLTVIAATVSLYKEVRQWMRSEINDYKVIYVKVTSDTLHERDQKGLYSGVITGKVKNVSGIDITAEEPVNPDLILENNQKKHDFSDFTNLILKL